MDVYLDRLKQLNLLMTAEEEHYKLQTALSFKMLTTLPLPSWIKVKSKVEGSWVVIFTNKEYTQRYSVNASDYYFVDEAKVWGEKTAISFNELDRKANDAQGTPLYGVEYINHPITNIRLELQVVKWALMSGKHVVGIAGIVLSEKEVEH